MTYALYDGKAKDYASFRLPYAAPTASAIVEMTGACSCWHVADIGTGTGALARLLASSVQRISALEPNDDMRHQAKSISGHHSITYLAATAESTGLAAESVDLITVGQALHWFDPVLAPRELQRILKPKGLVAVVWNRISGTHDPELSRYVSPTDALRASLPAVQHETWEQYLGGMRSAAGAPLSGACGYAAFEENCRVFFDQHAVNGVLTVTYTTEIVVGALLPECDSAIDSGAQML